MKRVLFMGVVLAVVLLAAPVFAQEAEERITDDTTVMEVEAEIMASEEMTIDQEMITLGNKERIGFIRMTAPEVAYELVMEFIYQPYETADGKWGYPCVGVERYLIVK